ncbi:MAG TPA: DUF4097 family beta strand repeat-containing protein [Candidatus Hydrogenedens sp.]|nr:DUF4097 family beta strand repeat-containing protein [Candidatus Hydrogenedens sp.]
MKKICILIVFALFLNYSSYAQDNKLIEGVKTGFDTVIKGIQQIGSYADEILRSNLFGNDQTIPYTTTRKYENQFSVSQNVTFLIKNEFGVVEIKSWNEPIVRIETTLTIGGQNRDTIENLTNTFQPKIANENNIISMENQFPEASVSYIKIDHVITVPRSAMVSVDNFFGDTRVLNIEGNVTINEQYGSVELENISGKVSIRTQGEFPLKANKILNGGTFYLSRTKAELIDVQGELNVYNLLGEVNIQKMGAGKYVFHSDSGILNIKLEEPSAFEIKGSLLGGKLNSNLPVVQKATGSLNVLELTNPDAKQRIELTGAFSEISIFKTDNIFLNSTAVISNFKPYSEISSWEEAVAEGDVLIINNQKGDVRILPVDEPKIKVRATRLVWVSSADKATSSLEKIYANLHRTENRIYITTGGNFEVLPESVSDWRVDIQVFCPPNMDISIESNEGQTACENISGPLRITQGSGSLSILKCSGPYFISNQKGNIKVEEATNTGEIRIRGGLVSLKNITAPVNITAVQAKVNLEDIQSKIFARVQSGDVHCLALNGINGDIDIQTEKGNISILLSSEADCNIKAIAQSGAIDSAIPLNGVFSRTRQEASTQLKEGKFSVLLQANDGDIVIDGNIPDTSSVNIQTNPSENTQNESVEK